MKTDQKKKKALGKALAVTTFRAAVLYLAYHHFIVPRQGGIPREMQRGLWMSLKNAWKMGRTGVLLLRAKPDLSSPRTAR